MAGGTAALAGLWLAACSVSAVAAPVSAERGRELLYLLRHDCGSCHGMTLRGGLGPALTPAALADKPAGLLVDSILRGRPGTAMPPWQGLLERAEAVWLVRQLQRGVDR